MECEHSTAGEAGSPAKKRPKTIRKLLHITTIQNLIPNGIANIQWKFQALNQTLYMWFVLENSVVLIMVELI